MNSIQTRNSKGCWIYLIQLDNKIKILPVIFLLFLISEISAQNTHADSFTQSENDTVFVMQKSPWGAVLRSAVLPGWGQFYNESYWKIPVIWGGTAALVFGWVDRNKLTVQYRDLYNQSINNGSPDESYKRLREFYKDQRDLFSVFIGLAYFINLVDAYVDAHLFDFDISENKITRAPELNVKFYFNRIGN